jgi:hypothetical protein
MRRAPRRRRRRCRRFVDYNALDADQELDDYWLEQRGRDEEERYFDD